MLVAEPVRTPLADGSEDVPGLSLAGLARAFRVVVRHVGPSAGLVQLEQGDFTLQSWRSIKKTGILG